MLNKNDIGKFPAILDPTKRQDFRLCYEVVLGNPNGDPDQDGHPRVLPDGRVFVTDVCIKRAIRNYAEDVLGRDIYVTANPNGRSLAGIAAEKKAHSREQAISTFWDVRFFGAVWLTAGKKKASPKKETPDVEQQDATNEDQRENSQILGPVQIGMGLSSEPPNIMEVTITRGVKQSDNELKNGEDNRTMGRKHVVEHARITHEGTVSGFLAKKHGITSEDLADFWEALANGIEHLPSANRRRRLVGVTITTYKGTFGRDGVETVTELKSDAAAG
mgnify:CR=1 FL=1